MTRDNFDRLIRYLEGAFRVHLEPNERDSYWITLHQDDDRVAWEKAVAYVRSERARYGFPRPGDLIDNRPVEAHPAYIEQARRDRLEARARMRLVGEIVPPAEEPA